MRGVWGTGGGRGLRGEEGKRGDGVSPVPPQSFRYQRRQVCMYECMYSDHIL